MSEVRRVVVVGSSIAGITAVEELRADGFEGSITVIGEEPDHPYMKPPLSKAFLSGAEGDADIRMPDLGHLDADFLTAREAVGLDVERRRVLLREEDSVPYDALVIATGARAATMADRGGNTAGVGETVLRTVADARHLRAELRPGRSLMVIGGGILGMEVASTAVDAGMDVTVVATSAPMRATVGHFLSELVRERAQSAGVHYRMVSGPIVLEPGVGGGRVRVGEDRIESDVLVSAVGCVPNVAWLEGTGLVTSPGLVVDERCRAAEHIFAAGDVVSIGRRARTPHWSAALAQGRSAAAALLHGDDAPIYQPRPYFWTHQFDLSLKIAGDLIPDGIPERVEGVEGEMAALWRWSIGGRPIAAAALNRHIPISRLHAMAGQA